MDIHPFNVLSLFSGGGGLDLGIKLAVPNARTVCFVEREAFACATLVHQMEKGGLAPCPVWTDATTFDGHPWRGMVDIITGGFPCQDISFAGKGAGIEGERSGLWRHFARIIEEVKPKWAFIENVAALVTRGLNVVLSDLAALGFDAEWGCFRASDVGAPHKRERLFILAHARNWVATGWRRAGNMADTSRKTQGQGNQRERSRDAFGNCSQVMAYTNGLGCDKGFGNLHAGKSDIERCRVQWPPNPDDAKGWEKYLQHWPGTEPAVRRDAHGLANRVDQLRLLGNGVVPQQAALAFQVLQKRVAS